MKNSLPKIKNRMMPVMMSAAYSFSEYAEAISDAPRSKKTSRKEISAI